MAKNQVYTVIDTKRLERDLRKVVGEETERALKRVTNKEKLSVGEAVIDEMLKAIAKGISPIKGRGRFEAYKWAGKKNADRKKGAKKKSLDLKYSNKYPYSAQGKFPDKKERPVNLKLSGNFLSNLKAKILGSSLYVGFFEEPWSKYEQGHREGAKGQPSRPIIPSGDGEEFSQSIYRRLVSQLQDVFDKKK